MPKIIRTVFDVIPDETLLVRSAYLRNDIKASALVTEARRRVSNLLSQSEHSAEQLYREAKAEGYAAGILQAAEALTQYLSTQTEVAAKLRQQLHEEVAVLLRRCVTDSDALMAAFEECLNEQDLASVPRLDMLLPESMRMNHRRLLERLQPHVNGQVNITYHQDARFVLRLGERVAEFSPDDFVAQAATRAMSELSSIYMEHRLIADRCREHLAALFAPPEADGFESAEKMEDVSMKVES